MTYYVPVEVLEQIISYLEPIQLTKSYRGPAWRGDVLLRKTLTAVAMASRTCRRLAEPYLYGAIDIDGFLDSYGSLKLLMHTFMRRRDLALHVRRIRVGDFVPDPASSTAKSGVISVNLNGSEALTPIALWTEKPDIILDAKSYNDLLRDKGHFPAIKFLDGSYTLGARHGSRVPYAPGYPYLTYNFYLGELVVQVVSDSTYAALDQITVEACLHHRAQYSGLDELPDPHYSITMQELPANITPAHWQEEFAGWRRVRDLSHQNGWTACFDEAGVFTIRRDVRNPS
ncbi:hypothetical protein HII31_10006, partial [Pseudocercospora fuligena]